MGAEPSREGGSLPSGPPRHASPTCRLCPTQGPACRAGHADAASPRLLPAPGRVGTGGWKPPRRVWMGAEGGVADQG